MNRDFKPQYINGRKALDVAIEKVERDILLKAKREKKMNPYLDKQLNRLEWIDNDIQSLENKIKELKKTKEKELMKMEELLDLAVKSTHSLKNGYTVSPDHRYKVEITDIGVFMKWMKENKEANEIFKFIKDSLKVTSVKRFVENEINLQRTRGVLFPTVDGVEILDKTFRRLKTEYKRRK